MQLVIGRIGGAHGVRGEVTVEVRTDEPELRFAPDALLATDPPGNGPLTVRALRWHGERLLVQFAESPDRSTAEGLRDTLLVVDSDALPPSTEPDEFNDHELVDLVAVTSAGKRVGRVADVQHLPGQDLLVVALDSGEQALIPFVAAIVHAVDRTAGRLVLDPPAGLIDTGGSE